MAAYFPGHWPSSVGAFEEYIMAHALFTLLSDFAEQVSEKLRLPGSGEPEEQIRAPLEFLIWKAGQVLHKDVRAQGEVRIKNVGRPDYAFYCNGALCGYAEIKRPGKGARPEEYRGHDKEQWEKFQMLPNILYSDGREWSLYQHGSRVAGVTLSGDVVNAGRAAVSEANAESFELLLQAFLSWQPVVPSDAAELAEILAPICRLLRGEVEEALKDEQSPFRLLYSEWQVTLFPGQSEARFADAYAQTVTFALLLANAEGGDVLDLRDAEQSLASEHALISKALKIFTDNLNPEEIPVSLGLLQRTVAAIPAGGWKGGGKDPWLYFYETFLAKYDRELKQNSGSYYTPVEVVQAMVRLTEEILMRKFGKTQGFASDGVMTLDPAAGTGTFLLGIVALSLQRIANKMGAGAAESYAEALGRQLYGFEIQVGPYAVAQLRLSRALTERRASLPTEGPNVYLTDTLESPDVTPQFPSLLSRELSTQHKMAIAVKKSTPILVCIGNPPYDRHGAADGKNLKETGGWVRWGDEDEYGRNHPERALLDDFARPVRESGQGVQLKNLYNLYVYFWRWALWKVFEQGAADAPGVVSFITASSFLEGPAFLGMRERMRRDCDEIWIIDLGGDGRGARTEENIFAIQTPVCITLAVRFGRRDADVPAKVHYARLRGNRREKLDALRGIVDFSSLTWKEVPSGWQAKMVPAGEGEYFSYPLLQDVFPWQQSGVKAGRTWVVGSDRELLKTRWKIILGADSPEERSKYFKDAPPSTGGCTIHSTPTGLFSSDHLEAVATASSDALYEKIVCYGYRSFDRQYILADARCLDRPGPPLWKTCGTRQLYFATKFSQVTGKGPLLTLSADVPDLDYFCNRGSKDIIPLYRDAAATRPNILPGLLEMLSAAYGVEITAEAFAAYAYAVLAHTDFTARFHEELNSREVRLPLTRDAGLFARAEAVGRRLIWLHSYGERMIPEGVLSGDIPSGAARCVKAVPAEEYPEDFSYNESTLELTVGQGIFSPVSPEVYDFEVSGLKVVQSWLSYRMKRRSGRKSSPLDDIRPQRWTAEYTAELLRLLWILEATLAEYPKQEELLDEILSGELFAASDLPDVPEEARKAPKSRSRAPQMVQTSLLTPS